MPRRALWLPLALLSFTAPALAQPAPGSDAPAPDAPASDAPAAPASEAAASDAPKGVPTIRKDSKLATKLARTRELRRLAAEEKRWPVRRPPKSKIRPVPPLGNIPFPDGEVLEFSIKMFGAEAAKAKFEVERKGTYGDRPTVTFRALLTGSAFLNKIYPLNDTLTLRVDEGSFRPVKSDFHIEENGKVIDYHTDFFQKRFQVLSTQTRKGKDLVRSFRTSEVIYDALSSMYAARRIELKPGLAFDYFVWDGKRERLISVEVKGQERVWTPVGWFDAMKLQITTRITGGFIAANVLDRPAKTGFAWIGLDEARTPVKLTTPTKLGDAEAILVRRAVPAKPE